MKHNQKLLCLVVLAILVVALTPSIITAFQDNPHTATIFENGSSIIFQTKNIGIILDTRWGSILSIKNLLTGQLTQLSEHYPLWAINTPGGSYFANQAEYFVPSIDSTNSRLIMFWQFAVPRFNISAIAEPNPGNGGISMKINVSNADPTVTIFSVNFPYIGGFSRLGNSSFDNLAIPHRDGLIIRNFQQALRNESVKFNYPGTLSMQFALIYDDSIGGIFEGVEDPSSNYKAFEISNHTFASSSFKIDWKLFAPDIYPGNQFIMNYSVTLAGFTGQDWADGAQLYKSWAVRQWYTKAGTLLDRTDVPTWLKDIGLVWKGSPPDILMPNVTSNLKQMFPNETALLDWWGWNHYGFDHGYPEYFPPIDGQSTLEAAIKQTHAEGGRVMLFFSGRIVDANTTTFQDNKQYMIIDQNGQLHLEQFAGGRLAAAVADPTSAWWRSEVVNFTTEAAKEYNIDGVYMDSLAIASPILNFANTTHPTLSGSTWWRAFADILTQVRTQIRQFNPNAIITSEGVSEVYIPYIDAFWDNLNQDIASGVPNATQVPIFSFVYHQYALVYGTPLSYMQPPAFRYELSKSVAFGLIPRPDAPIAQFSDNDSRFMRSVVGIEQSYIEYFRFGEELSSPIIYSQPSSFQATYHTNSGVLNVSLTIPSVLGGLFRASNGSILLALVNPTSSAQEITLHFYPEQFGFSILNSVKACRLNPTSNNCVVTDNNDDIVLTLGTLSYELLIITPHGSQLITPPATPPASMLWVYVLIASSILVPSTLALLLYHRRLTIALR